MTTRFTMHDGRTLARIINLAHRLGCGFSSLAVEPAGTLLSARVEFSGEPDGLRRLRAQLDRVLACEAEPLR